MQDRAGMVWIAVSAFARAGARHPGGARRVPNISARPPPARGRKRGIELDGCLIGLDRPVGRHSTRAGFVVAGSEIRLERLGTHGPALLRPASPVAG